MAIRSWVTVFVAGLSVLAVACASSSAPGEDGTKSDQQGLSGGCRIVCPNCHPNEVCPMIACEEQCYPPPPRCVETMMCPVGYTWSAQACSCVP